MYLPWESRGESSDVTCALVCWNATLWPRPAVALYLYLYLYLYSVHERIAMSLDWILRTDLYYFLSRTRTRTCIERFP